MAGSHKIWRWFRFRLRTLLVVWLALGAWIGWWIVSSREQRDAVANIQTLTSPSLFAPNLAYIDYSYEMIDDGPSSPTTPRDSTATCWVPGTRPNSDTTAKSWVPDFALNRLGRDFFHNVSYVEVIRSSRGDALKLAEQLARLRNLRHLVLLDVGATDAVVSRISALRKLTSLELGRAGSLTDDALRSIGNVRSLRALDVSGQFSDAGLEKLRRLTKLELLCLEGDDFSDAGLAHLRQLTKLKGLSLGSPRISDQGLSELAQLPDLEWLCLMSSHITGKGIAQLAACKRLRSLTLLQLRITDDDLQHLGSLQSLESICLQSAGISGVGFEHLSGLTKLKRLYLQGTRINDHAIMFLARLPSLEQIDLGGTAVTAAGLEQFKDAPNLRRIIIPRNEETYSLIDVILGRPREAHGFSAGDLAHLQKVLPKCKIDEYRDF
jgi:Leucine-rich repeat (LRR) protein